MTPPEPHPKPPPLILVDELVNWPQKAKPGLARRYFGNGKPSCHLTVDGPIEALHAFARRLALVPEWFQPDGDHILPHYDLTPGKRSQAIALGALGVTGTTLIRIRTAHVSTWAVHHQQPCACKACHRMTTAGGPERARQTRDEHVLAAQLASPASSPHRIAGLCRRARTIAWLAPKLGELDAVVRHAEDLRLDRPDHDHDPIRNAGERLRRARELLNEMLTAMPAPPDMFEMEIVYELIAAATPPAGRRRLR
jgi:hypothetical protein